MSDTIIKIENLSKQYRLGEIGTGSLAHDVNRWWYKVRGKENPYLKIGETNDRTTSGNSEYVWSLRDISFDIKQGDAVGIIGRNGAGKSTLLKVLSQVTAPTTGTVKVKGRIASLLEVGTGFHPDLSGRDNIYLNGAILGMRKAEIKRKFDEIVDFSGVERYIDTPVKRYSSGMYVRLAFAVAAHLESEILIVDEVLAVGDAEFQKKCLGKMGDVSKGEGRTVLFVSHNMSAIANLCSTSVMLQNGTFVANGPTSDIIGHYMLMGDVQSGYKKHEDIVFKRKNPDFDIQSVSLVGNAGVNSEFSLSEDIACEVEFTVNNPTTVTLSIHLLDKYGECILATFNADSASLNKDPLYNVVLEKGNYKSICVIPANFLNESSYKISVFLSRNTSFEEMTIAESVVSFQTVDLGETSKDHATEWIGIVRPRLNWNTKKVN